MKKKYILTLLIAILVFSIYTYTREYELKDCMSYDDLSKIVKRDMVVFDEGELPIEMLDKLAEYKVVMTGETTHYIKEYYEFLPHLAIELHKKHGFNTLLLETPQAFSWIFEDYANDLLPIFSDEEKFKYIMTLINLDKIREYNLNLADEDKINVHTIDINHNKRNFINSLELMRNYVESDFLIDLLDTSIKLNGENYLTKLKNYYEYIDQPIIKESLTNKWYNRIKKMITVEIESYKCRDLLDNGEVKQRYYEREEYIKKTVDEHLKNVEGKVLLNMGATHIQKERIMGTDIVWTGEYLSKISDNAKNNTYCLLVQFAKGTNRYGDFDLKDVKMKNCLSKIIAEETSDKTGFLSYDNLVFANNSIAYFGSKKYNPITPKDVWDGVLMLPHSTYDERYKDSYIIK